MGLRSFDSQTRLGIPRPPKSQRGGSSVAHSAAHPAPHHCEQYADEGTLILEPAPISVVPPSYATIPPPPPSSMRPMMYSVPLPSSVRPTMPSWDDRSGWAPPAGPNEITASTRAPAKRPLSARERSASAMLGIATAAMLAALVSIGFMHKAGHGTETESATTAAGQPVSQPVAVEANAATIPAPSAAPIAPPVQPIDIDDVEPTPAAAPKAAPVAAAAPQVGPATPNARETAPAPQTKPTTEPKQKAPSQTAQEKALEDLLEQLGEEQLKR